MDGKVSVKMKPPRVPNYVTLDTGHDGAKATIRVSELSDEAKDWLAAEFRRGLDQVPPKSSR